MKYRLKKEYPGLSLKKGDVIDSSIYIHQYSTQPINCADYPEYWEEVIEKDYQILSLISPYGPLPVNIINNESIFLSDIRYKIHSVKRLSDGEIFTVGDYYKHQVGTIEKINSIDFGQLIGHDISFNKYNARFDLVKKKVNKLFTTEDGIDIFEGNEYFTVYTMNDSRYKTWSTQTIPFIADGFKDDYIFENVKYFSTKEAAKNYILKNKPCLSLNDITSVFSYMSADTIYKFENIIKSKIDGNK